jgi:Peptidase family M28
MTRAAVFILAAAVLSGTAGHTSIAAQQKPATPAAAPTSGFSDTDPRIAELLANISEQRMRQLLEKLVSFGTRNTLSRTDSPTRGIGAARQWILEEMQRSSKRLQVSFDTHQIPEGGRITRAVELRNVIAILPGKSPRRIYISGHYDSLNLDQSRRPGSAAGSGQMALNTGQGGQGGQRAGAGGGASAANQPPQPPPNYDIDAPGANDDGSGTVLTMELARVFAESGIEFDATLVFAALAGEEQGLVGARYHAEAAKKNNTPIQAVLNNDIVGNAISGNGITDGQSIKVYSEGPEDSPSRAIARYVVKTAARYVPSHRVRPMARHDRFGRGGDHSGFNQHGFAGIVFREARENYSMQHNAKDTLDGVSYPYLLQNARVNAAAAAVMALAPPPPNVNSERGTPMLGRQPTGYDANMRWQASPGAVGYRIYWRDAWTPDWQHEMTVGNVTEYVMPNVSIDEYVFGIAAIGPGGHESPIAAYVYQQRRYE